MIPEEPLKEGKRRFLEAIKSGATIEAMMSAAAHHLRELAADSLEMGSGDQIWKTQDALRRLCDWTTGLTYSIDPDELDQTWELILTKYVPESPKNVDEASPKAKALMCHYELTRCFRFSHEFCLSLLEYLAKAPEGNLSSVTSVEKVPEESRHKKTLNTWLLFNNPN